jgi:Ser/Thr protein kinase RdoA (MazF antagonist)
VDDPRVVADSNHTLVWLRPHEIVAKVGRPSADGALLREHEICTALAQAGAPVAPPVPNVDPAREPETGLLVTLWQRFEHGNEDDADPADVGKSLSEVHDALDFYEGELPSFLQKLESSRALLSDEVRTKALSPENRCFLRAAFDALMDELTSCDYRVQRIHGEPHGTNRLTTPEGVRWIDFEGSCVGPVEWDLAFVPQRAFMAFPPPDEPLLELLRTLISARVATLCWERYDVPALRWHAEFHLEQVRSRSPSILPR